MKSKILGLLAMGLLAGPIAANAIVRTYDFTVNGGTSGPLMGVTSSGYFSFDESIIPSGGGAVNQVGLLTDLSFNWNSVAYDENSANTGRLSFNSSGELVPQFFFGSVCVAGNCQITSGFDQWFINQFVNGPSITNQFSYGIAGIQSQLFDGSFTLSLRAPSVPEPGTLALLGLGLAGLGLSRRRKA